MWWQQAKQGGPDVPLPSNVLQLLLGDPKPSEIYNLPKGKAAAPCSSCGLYQTRQIGPAVVDDSSRVYDSLLVWPVTWDQFALETLPGVTALDNTAPRFTKIHKPLHHDNVVIFGELILLWISFLTDKKHEQVIL